MAVAIPAHRRVPARPRSAHAPVPHWPRSRRHQAHLRAHRVGLFILSPTFYSLHIPRSAILIQTAVIAYGRPPDFPVQARGEPEISERVAWSLRHPRKKLKEAMPREGFDAERAARIWDKWEGGRWKTGRFRQRVPSRL
jgi:hypothetical protein